MIMDERNEFADAVSVAAAAGTILVGDVIDSGEVVRNLGSGQPVYLNITVDTEVITGGVAGTIEFQLVSDAAAAIATDGSATVHYSSGELVTGAAGANADSLNAGATIVSVPLPAQDTYERYFGILAVIGTTTTTAGAINAFLSLDPIGWKAYPEGNN